MLLGLPDIGQGAIKSGELEDKKGEKEGEGERGREQQWAEEPDAVSGMLAQCPFSDVMYRKPNPVQGNPLTPERYDSKTTQETPL